MLHTLGALSLLFVLGSSQDEGSGTPAPVSGTPAPVSPINCEGGWGECTAECKKTYAVTTAAADGGDSCEAADGAEDDCAADEGECRGPCTDECSKRYATERMCDAERDNTYYSGSHLTLCPEACFHNGFDNGQCPTGTVSTNEEKTDAGWQEDDLSSWETEQKGLDTFLTPDLGSFQCDTETRCVLSCEIGKVARGRTVTVYADGKWSPDPREWDCVESWVLVVAGLPMSSTIEVYGQSFHKKLPNLESPRMGLGAENVDGHIIMCGGVPMEFEVHFPVPFAHQECLRLNTETWKWEKYVYTHHGRDIHGQVNLDGRLYWIGGDRSPNTMEWIEPNKYPLEWNLVDIPFETKHCSAAKISETEFMITGGFYEAKAARIYNIRTEEWRDLPNMANCRSGHGSAYIEEMVDGVLVRGVLVAGGFPTCNSEQLNTRVSFAVSASTEFWDLDKEEWRTMADMPRAKRGVRMIFTEGKASLFGGLYKHPFVPGNPEFDDLDAYQFDHRVSRFSLATESWADGEPLYEIRNFPSLTLVPREWFPETEKCSDDCSIEDATEYNCDRFKDNAVGSDFFLTKCPEKCYLAGFDYDQCPFGAEGGEPQLRPEPYECKDEPTEWMNNYAATCEMLKSDDQCFGGYFWQDHCPKTCGLCGHRADVCQAFTGIGQGDGEFQRDETRPANGAPTYWRNDGEAFWFSCGPTFKLWAVTHKSKYSAEVECRGWATSPDFPIYDVSKVEFYQEGWWQPAPESATSIVTKTTCSAPDSTPPLDETCMRLENLRVADGDYQADETKTIYGEPTYWRADKTMYWYWCSQDVGYYTLAPASSWDLAAQLEAERVEALKTQAGGFSNDEMLKYGVPCRGFFQATAMNAGASFKTFEDGTWRKIGKAKFAEMEGACGLQIPAPFESASSVDVGFAPAGCGKKGGHLPSGVPKSHPAVPIPDFDICFSNARGHAQMFQCLDSGNLKLITYHDPECKSQRNIHDGDAPFTIFENGVCNDDGVEYSLTLNWDPNDCPIADCEVSEFGLWDECTVSCGGGIQRRERTVTQEKIGNGADCRSLTETRVCNVEACKDCKGVPDGPAINYDKQRDRCCASGNLNSCGQCDGVEPCDCDWQCYLDSYGDLRDLRKAADLVGAEQHWLDIGKNELRVCGCGCKDKHLTDRKKCKRDVKCVWSQIKNKCLDAPEGSPTLCEFMSRKQCRDLAKHSQCYYDRFDRQCKDMELTACEDVENPSRQNCRKNKPKGFCIYDELRNVCVGRPEE